MTKDQREVHIECDDASGDLFATLKGGDGPITLILHEKEFPEVKNSRVVPIRTTLIPNLKTRLRTATETQRLQ